MPKVIEARSILIAGGRSSDDRRGGIGGVVDTGGWWAPTPIAHDLHIGCLRDATAPPSVELATHCVMKFMPSTPSATLG